MARGNGAAVAIKMAAEGTAGINRGCNFIEPRGNRANTGFSVAARSPFFLTAMLAVGPEISGR